MKRMLFAAFGIFVFSLQGAAEKKQKSIIPVLASRLVDLKTREVTEPVKILLEMTKTPTSDFSLVGVVAQTQKDWVSPNWDFTKTEIKEGVDIVAVRKHVDSMFKGRDGDLAPRVLCQGGGLGTMLQTCAALSKLTHVFPGLEITFAYRSLPVHFTESTPEHYKGVLNLLGRDSENITTPKSFPELVAFFRHAYPSLNKCDITYINVQDQAKIDGFKSLNKEKSFCVAAAPLQAAASAQSLQATFPDITLTGIQTIGTEAVKMCEPLYADAAGPKEQLAARLHHIARELFYINENLSQLSQQ